MSDLPPAHQPPADVTLVTKDDIEDAAELLEGVALRTPLVPFPRSEPTLLVKAESLQPVGSFKLRGAYATIAGLPEEQRARGVVAHSSGNHAQAVAYTAKLLGIPAVLVVPHTAPEVKVAACQALGAEIVFVEPSTEARLTMANRLAAAHDYTFVPPFDDPRVIAGQGTVGLEIIADAPETDLVLVPICGGGLISGIATAVKSLRPEAKVIGVEPELAADAQESLRMGARVAWPAEDTARTIADGLRAEKVGEHPFAHMTKYVDDIVTVTENEIREAIRQLALRARLVAEPSGAVTTAAYLFHRDELPDVRTYVAVLSGGNIESELLTELLAIRAAG